MSLETEAAALPGRLAAGGLAASRRLSLRRFPFNGSFAGDTSQSWVLGGAGKDQPAAQSAGPGGGAARGALRPLAGGAERVTRILPAQRVRR